MVTPKVFKGSFHGGGGGLGDGVGVGGLFLKTRVCIHRLIYMKILQERAVTSQPIQEKWIRGDT